MIVKCQIFSRTGEVFILSMICSSVGYTVKVSVSFFYFYHLIRCSIIDLSYM